MPASARWGGIRGNAEALGDGVGALESNAVDVDSEAIRIRLDERNGVVPVALVYAVREARRHAVSLQEEHDLAQRPLLMPGRLNLLDTLRADALHIEELLRRVVDDGERVDAEAGDNARRHLRADAPDESTAQVFLDAGERDWPHHLVGGDFKLGAILAALHPLAGEAQRGARLHSEEIPHDGDGFGALRDAHLHDAPGVFVGDVGDALQHPFQGFLRRGCRRRFRRNGSSCL